MLTRLTNCNTGGRITDIAVKDGKIADLTSCANEPAEIIDVGGLHVYPGLVDIHAHGCMGYDTMDGEGESLLKMSEYLASHGTLSWLPTTMTEDFESIRRAVTAPLPTKGAEILGFHAEGPYISEKRKGAQNGKYIKDPDFGEFKTLLSDKGVKIVTLAPEKEGSESFIKSCVSAGCVLSIGHTDADYDRTLAAADAGARCLTHVFNAMPGIHHRAPGPIGAAIDSDMYVQVICDGLHIHKSVIKMLYRTFGPDRMILISDSMRATGLSDGRYMFGGQPVIVKDSIARTEADGALAGSTSTLFTCVKKAVEFGIPESDAFRMASATPSALMGFRRKGRLSVGCDADILAVDENLGLRLIIKGGKTIFRDI
jgi:N-acetylglucosamine-6-phosphate deacetylase